MTRGHAPARRRVVKGAARKAPRQLEARAQAYRDATDAQHKKAWGQFFTSPALAAFMASLFRVPTRDPVRVLDAGAGTGVLGFAAAEHFIARFGRRVHLTAVEQEPGALRVLRQAAAAARRRLGTNRLRIAIVAGDFLAAGAPGADFDCAIANPPYFKMSPADPRGGRAPNAYARFMDVAAGMLREQGELCFIVPRSYAAGRYFRGFRRGFHWRMRLDRVHVLESRADAFRADHVLQENLIVLYRRSTQPAATVRVSASTGEADVGASRGHRVPRACVLHPGDPEAALFLPTRAHDLRVLDRFAGWRDRLGSYGLGVSTGKVVPFRAQAHLRARPSPTTAPLLWLQHVRPGRVVWPLAGGFRKPEHIATGAPPRLLVRNQTYVLLRRFSAKEDTRRLVAAPCCRGALPGAVLGLENHLNFIHRPDGELEPWLAVALAALFNSSLVDAYVRLSNGNTQVSATELRALPLPPPHLLAALGRRLQAGEPSEQAVGRLFGRG